MTKTWTQLLAEYKLKLGLRLQKLRKDFWERFSWIFNLEMGFRYVFVLPKKRLVMILWKNL